MYIVVWNIYEQDAMHVYVLRFHFENIPEEFQAYFGDCSWLYKISGSILITGHIEQIFHLFS